MQQNTEPYMHSAPNKHKRSHGFAVLITLISLATLVSITALIIVKTKSYSSTPATLTAARVMALSNQARVIAALIQADPETSIFTLEDMTYHVTPVMGLIDLNASDTTLLKWWLEQQNLPYAMETYLRYRDEDKTFQSVDEALALLAVPMENHDTWRRLTTVHSGRRLPNLKYLPDELSAPLQETAPEIYSSLPSRNLAPQTQLITRETMNDRRIPIAVITTSPSDMRHKLVELW